MKGPRPRLPAPGRASGAHCGKPCRTIAMPAAGPWRGSTRRRIGSPPNSPTVHAASAHVLVAADGLHSAVRSKMLPTIAPRYAGYVAWRGVVKEPDAAPELHRL